MKDLLARFRFGDFSAYFLPGLVMVGAIAAGVSLVGLPIRSALRELGLAEYVVIACAAYVCGAVISGSSYALIGPIYRVTRLKKYVDPRASVHPHELAAPVETALAELLGTRIPRGWSEDHFYLARTAVHERLPQTSAEAMRQNDLMRLRENMLIPLLAWWAVGVGYAGAILRPQNAVAAWACAGGITIVAYILTGRVACRSVDNRGREVREICVGFLIGHRMGLFNPTQQPQATAPRAQEPAPAQLTADSAKLPVVGPVAGST